MKVTQVALRPTEASTAAGRPALTPELLAASGARYSRNNEGLDAILAKIDPHNLDKSVDSIFRMLDYGHASIADMAPAAMFIDGVSLWLAYYVWTLCPVAGGQESSTRYIKLSPDSLIAPERLGLSEAREGAWRERMAQSFAAYEAALGYWEAWAQRDPDVARIPRRLVDDPSEKAQKQVARMRRNYGFDRARYFLPAAAPTNVMLLMPARAWVNLCQHLLSHRLPEAQALGKAIRDELELCAPRLLKHAVARDSIQHGLAREFGQAQRLAQQPAPHLTGDAAAECPPCAWLEVLPPPGVTEAELAEDLAFHDNRYAWLGAGLRRTAVRFGWNAVALAELRDLNRHRTGTKFCPFAPVGFYAALDQVPEGSQQEAGGRRQEANLARLAAIGRAISTQARELLAEGDPTYVYWTLLGTQVAFEHTTTADKFLYQVELRTGVGAHFRYAEHMRDVAEFWFDRFPATRALIQIGAAEPE